jgi:hypothetical protein
MRTTLDIDDDVLAAAKERAQRERKSIGTVMSELARHALISAHPVTPIGVTKAVHGFRAFPARGGIVTNGQINRLRKSDVY